MNLQRESYVQASRRQEQLANIDTRWQLVNLAHSQGQTSILNKAKTWLHRVTQNGKSGFNPSLETN